MNRGTLPILARLRTLQTPAHVAPGGNRVLAGPSDPNPLASLLRELHETMLGRYLTLESSGGPSLTLEVSGRRVLRMTGSTGLPGAEACLAAQALEDEHKDDLIKLLQAVAAPGHELRVSALPNPREGAGVSVGIPVALLADLLLIDLNPAASLSFAEAAAEKAAEPAPMLHASEPEVAEPSQEVVAPAPERIAIPSRRTVRAIVPAPEADLPEPEPETPKAEMSRLQPDIVASTAAHHVLQAGFLAALAGAIGPVMVAWLIVGGDEDGLMEGPEEMISHLQGFLGDEAKALGDQLDLISTPPGSPICIVLGAALVEGHSILCARNGAGILLGVIEGDATQSVLRAWAARLRG